jgi:uncharacterized membrane protein YfcA
MIADSRSRRPVRCVLTGTILWASLILLVGSCVQGAVGFGASVFAAPLLELVDPVLVPVPLIMAAIGMNVGVLLRDREHASWQAVRWPIIGQLPGALLGALIVALAGNQSSITVLFAAMTLIAVGISTSRWHPRKITTSMVAAGSVSGFIQTIAGFGGPPLAILYQDEQGPRQRAMLARYFIVASSVSLAVLAVSRHLPAPRPCAQGALEATTGTGDRRDGCDRRPGPHSLLSPGDPYKGRSPGQVPGLLVQQVALITRRAAGSAT